MHDTANLPLLIAETAVPGLVWAFRAPPRQRAATLAPSEILSALAEPTGWVWLHVDLLDQRAPSWLTRHCALPASARAILDAHEDAIGLGHEDGVVHGIFVDFERELSEQSLAVGMVFFALTQRLLVTGRRHPLATLPAIRQALEEGALFADSSNCSVRSSWPFVATPAPASALQRTSSTSWKITSSTSTSRTSAFD